jgi:tRNA (uracil-5-)-methyltransferase TRM9
MEDQYVLQPYTEIADRFDKTRSGYRWRGIEEHVKSIETTSLILDAGCGNGRNMTIKNNRNYIGFDFCEENNKICSKRGLEVSTINIKRIPIRDSVFDHSFTVAVLHHIEKEDDRVQAINELVRVTRPGGTIFIQVWSADIPKNKKFIKINDNNDFFVTWYVKKDYLIKRYYHLFTKSEFISILSRISSIEVLKVEEEVGNWLGIIKKI